MAKVKSAFFCQNCGHETPKWLGKCPSCNEWNTFVEELIQKQVPQVVAFSKSQQSSKPQALTEIEGVEHPRIAMGDSELDRVLGGGLVPGSLILFGGEPGIGKSTLLLQIAVNMSNRKILYVSGEESDQQIKMRSERIGVTNQNCFILTETNVQSIFSQAEQVQPELMVIDLSLIHI